MLADAYLFVLVGGDSRGGSVFLHSYRFMLVGSGLLGGSVGRRLGWQLAGFVFSGMSLGFIWNPNSLP